VERFADGQASDSDLGTAYSALEALVKEKEAGEGVGNATLAALHALLWTVENSTQAEEEVPNQTCRALTCSNPQAQRSEAEAVCKLHRDIFGNPFRPVSLNPGWLTSGRIALAKGVYDNRQLPSGYLDADRLAVLADALEEAGCDNAEILGHLRGPGPHVRGCWPIDLLLGKE